jgi:hypothetical protein
LANSAAAQSLEVYWSDQFDDLFFYDPAVWAVEEAWSDQESDYVVLSSGETYVYFLAMAAPDITPQSCLEDFLAEFAADPEIVAIAPLTGEGDEPVIEPVIELEDGGAVTRLLLTIDEAGDRYQLATEERCLQLVPGESVLYISNNVPAEVYNELGGVDPFGNVPALVLSGPDLIALPGQTAVGRVGVPAPDGTIIGTLEAHVHCVADGPPQLLVIADAVTATEPFTVDPDAFVLTTDTGKEQPAIFGDWLYAESAGEPVPLDHPGRPLDTAPGAFALLGLELPDATAFAVSYAPDSAAPPEARLHLGSIHPDACAPPATAFPPSLHLD